jgi:hypothetical protein
MAPCAAALFVCQSGGVAEEPLDGGIAHAGQVVRVGSHVLRPSSRHSGSIHAFLREVRHAGFEGASFPVGIDADGRERLVFIDGEVPVAPDAGHDVTLVRDGRPWATITPA